MRNQTKAWEDAKEYFNLQKGEVMHHKDITLKYTDPERYKQWRIEDLVVMTRSEHTKLHNYDRKGKHWGGQKKGCSRTKGSTGMHWYNNGTDDVMAYECPVGFVKGRLHGTCCNKDEKGRFTKANTEVIQKIA